MTDDWKKVLTIIVSILVPLLSGFCYVISQQHELDKKVALLQGRLEWSGVIPVETRTLTTTDDVRDFFEHLKARGER